MKAQCTLGRLPDGHWRIHHASAALGEVALTAASREDAVGKMRRELQYRLELCPCSGVSAGTIELDVSERFPPS